MLLRKYWKLLLLTFISFGIFFSSSQVTNQIVHADNTDNQSVTLQINYLDSENYQPISSSTSITGNAGSSYHITPSQISNYKFFGSSDPINGTFTSGDNVINLYYNTEPAASSNASNSSGTGANKTAQSPANSPKPASNNISSKSSNPTSTTKNNNGTSSNSPTSAIVKNSNKAANNTTNATNTNKSSNKNGSDKSGTNNTADNSAVEDTTDNGNNSNDKSKVKKSENKKKDTTNKTDKKSDKQDKKTKSSKTPWIITIIVLILAGTVGGFIWHRSHKPEHFKH